MRVKIKDQILNVRFVSHNDDSCLFFVHTWKDNEVWIVQVDKSEYEISEMWETLLKDGWIDFTGCRVES